VDSGLHPDPRAYVARPATEEALERLEAAVRLGRPGLLSGPPGTGKTLMLRLLGERLDPYFEVVPLSEAALPFDELCGWICQILDAPSSDRPAPDQLVDLATQRAMLDRPVVLLLDDAGARSCDTVRRLAELARSSSGALGLALAQGGSDRADLARACGDRVVDVSLATPMRRDEVADYVKASLARARVPDRVRARFAPDVLEQLYDASAGNPRRVRELTRRLVVDGRLPLVPTSIAAAPAPAGVAPGLQIPPGFHAVLEAKPVPTWFKLATLVLAAAATVGLIFVMSGVSPLRP
jgi:type II secretory pathway predicted ATPase ExeA